MDYNPFQIRQLITNYLTPEEFNDLVYYHFPAVNSQFADGQTQPARIRFLIEYCKTHQEIAKLLEKIGEINSQAFTNLLMNSPSITESMNQLNDNEKYLMYIDFEKGVQIFQQTLENFQYQQAQQEQNKKRVNFGLFFIEDLFNQEGELYLQRLQHELTSKINSPEPDIFRLCSVKYTSGDLTNVVQKIATFFKVKTFEEISFQEKISFDEYVNLVINKMAQSLINNSVIFINIFCDLSDASDIELFVPWFIKTFWNPLTEKTENIIGDYDNIKIIAIINSDWQLEERLSSQQLEPYINKNNHSLSRKKMIHIPLTDWGKSDISKWLKRVKPRWEDGEIEQKAQTIYNKAKGTGGTPKSVRRALKNEGLL